MLEAAKAVNAAQFVLVSPAGSAGGAGFLGGLFGGGGGGGSSQLEQVLASCPLALLAKHLVPQQRMLAATQGVPVGIALPLWVHAIIACTAQGKAGMPDVARTVTASVSTPMRTGGGQQRHPLHHPAHGQGGGR